MLLALMRQIRRKRIENLIFIILRVLCLFIAFNRQIYEYITALSEMWQNMLYKFAMNNSFACTVPDDANIYMIVNLYADRR